jgi:hypothetical protein
MARQPQQHGKGTKDNRAAKDGNHDHEGIMLL